MAGQLHKVPSTLAQLFGNIANTQVLKPFTTILFRLVLYSEETWTSTQLFLLAHHSQNGISNQVGMPTSARSSNFILHQFLGLLEVIRSDSNAEDVVQFIHESVGEFMLGAQGLIHLDPALSSNPIGLTYDMKAKACAKYIASCSIPDQYRSFLDQPTTMSRSIHQYILSEIPRTFPL